MNEPRRVWTRAESYSQAAHACIIEARRESYGLMGKLKLPTFEKYPKADNCGATKD